MNLTKLALPSLILSLALIYSSSALAWGFTTGADVIIKTVEADETGNVYIIADRVICTGSVPAGLQKYGYVNPNVTQVPDASRNRLLQVFLSAQLSGKPVRLFGNQFTLPDGRVVCAVGAIESGVP